MKAFGLDFIRRVMATSAVLAMLQLLFVSVYYDWRFALAIFVGTAWGIANLHFLGELIVEIITPAPLKKKKVILVSLIKFPVLYGAGYVILAHSGLPILGFAIGFTSLFVVAVLKVLGRLLNEKLAGRQATKQATPPVKA